MFAMSSLQTDMFALKILFARAKSCWWLVDLFFLARYHVPFSPPHHLAWRPNMSPAKLNDAIGAQRDDCVVQLRTRGSRLSQRPSACF